MENNGEPKQGGYYYSVTDEQIKEHRQRSATQILEWLESTVELMWRLQTPAEKEIASRLRAGENI